jgi:hypothetical protein
MHTFVCHNSLSWWAQNLYFQDHSVWIAGGRTDKSFCDFYFISELFRVIEGVKNVVGKENKKLLKN